MDFTGLYRRYAPDVFRFALHLTGNRAVAEDIASETFVRAWTARDRLRAVTVKGYLLMIARNLYRDSLRGPDGREVAVAINAPDPASGPEASASARSDLAAALERLRRLPELDRSILVMAGIEQLAYDEIASIVGLSVAAVRVRVHRARLKIQDPKHDKERV